MYSVCVQARVYTIYASKLYKYRNIARALTMEPPNPKW